ncbi:hypothetical protein C8R44DRAFT_878772 [Mycena epipterygia]|nr:hypothetical protein C8R44DRAFT_878772 [Mycena epipterygia]
MATACPNGEGPPMNTDISGIGVRFSFYLQTLFLSNANFFFVSVAPTNTATAANTATAVTALIWWVYRISSYTVFAFAFAMLIMAPSFGTTPECNPHAVVLFRTFSVLESGQTVCCVVTVLVVAVYTSLLFKGHIPPAPRLVHHQELPMTSPDDIVPSRAMPPGSPQAKCNTTPSWQFGQVLPMFLIVLPLPNLVNAFLDFGLRPLPV